MIEIKANRNIYLDGELLTFQKSSMNEFLMSSLSCPIKLDENLLIGDLVHILYDIKEFINLYCGEEYEVGRVLIANGNLLESKDYIRIFKNLEINELNCLNINIKSELMSLSDKGKIQKVSNLKIILDDKFVDEDEVLKDDEFVVKTEFTLLDLIEVIFEDFVFSLKRDNLLT